jgi:hypothetical protein
MAQHATLGAGEFNASELKKGLVAVSGDSVDLSALHGITDSHFNCVGMGGGPGTTNTAVTAITVRYRQLLAAHHQKLNSSTSTTTPLSERLAPIKDVLSLCVQTELQFASPTLHSTCDFRPYQQLYLDPAIELIRAELELVKANISTNPAAYRTLLASLSTADRKIYNSCFEKSVNVDLGGDPAAYATMLERCAALKAECEFVKVDKQPTSDLIPLVLMVREQIPAYKAMVEGVVAQAAAAISGAAPPTTIYRPGDQTKSPYRMVEKALTKGPNHEYPDCSQILDVFGCIIKCDDYAAMAAVVDAFTKQHTSGTVQITRMKDRWNTPSDGGWRDLMLNILVNGKVVFEVQVVLRAMLAARSAMDAHKAYNQFRSFAEVFGLLELPMEVVSAGDGGVMNGDNGRDGGDGWTAGVVGGSAAAAAAAAAAARIFDLEAENKRLAGENAALEVSKAAVEASKAAVEASKAIADGLNAELEAKVAAVEAEKAAVEAENVEWLLNAQWLDVRLDIVEREKAALLTARATHAAQLEAKVAAVEAEKAAANGWITELEAKVAAVEAERDAHKQQHGSLKPR